MTDRTFLGSAVRLEVTLDGGQRVLVEASSHDAGVALGERVGLRILADSVVVADTAGIARPRRCRVGGRPAWAATRPAPRLTSTAAAAPC